MTLIESIQEWEINGQTDRFCFMLAEDELSAIENLNELYEIKIEDAENYWFYKVFRVTITAKRLFLSL